MWNKTGGRLAYHGYQAFLEGDGQISVKTAHEIGVRLAQEVWGDRFEVVVATHLNTGHYHNHFCLNSVSFAGGYKYHDTKEDIRRMRDTSDAICRAYGLSVEKAPKIDQNKRRNYSEWKDKREDKVTLRSIVKADIDAAIAYSRSEEEFVSVMRSMGYKFIIKTETGKYLKYAKLRLPNSDRCVRLESLGPGYDLDDYRPRIIRNSVQSVDPFDNLETIPTEDKTLYRAYRTCRLPCCVHLSRYSAESLCKKMQVSRVFS